MVTNKDTLMPAYSAQCEGIIWKIILDQIKEIIVWECRSTDKKVSFYAYDIKNKQILLNNFKFDDDWGLSINTAKNGILYFNGHESDYSPVQKGLLAFDLHTSQILWQNFSISAHLFCAEGIVVFDTKILPRKYRLLAYQTAKKINDVDVLEIGKFRSLENSILLPTMIEAPSITDVTFQLVFNNLVISSGYLQQQNKINQYLQVEKNGEIVFEETISHNIQKIGFDTFFVWHNHLFYIRNKTELVSYFVLLQNF